MKKLKILLIVLLHLITFIIIGILDYQWAQNNNRGFYISFFPFITYLFISVPIFLVLTIFYIFYNKINKIVRKIVWFVFSTIIIISTFYGLYWLIYIIPFIPGDGDEGFAFVMASVCNSIFLVGITAFIFLLSKKFFEDIFGNVKKKNNS